MGRYARLGGAALALMLGGCAYIAQLQYDMQPGRPSQLACRGDFAQFKNGFFYTRPMALHFAVYWTAPTPTVIPLEGGAPAQTVLLTPLELSFVVRYQGYDVAYRLNRVNGTFSQQPNLGGIFSGTCEFNTLSIKV